MKPNDVSQAYWDSLSPASKRDVLHVRANPVKEAPKYAAVVSETGKEIKYIPNLVTEIQSLYQKMKLIQSVSSMLKHNAKLKEHSEHLIHGYEARISVMVSTLLDAERFNTSTREQ